MSDYIYVRLELMEKSDHSDYNKINKTYSVVFVEQRWLRYSLTLTPPYYSQTFLHELCSIFNALKNEAKWLQRFKLKHKQQPPCF